MKKDHFFMLSSFRAAVRGALHSNCPADGGSRPHLRNVAKLHPWGLQSSWTFVNWSEICLLRQTFHEGQWGARFDQRLDRFDPATILMLADLRSRPAPPGARIDDDVHDVRLAAVSLPVRVTERFA
jgi:hypothetical protein